MESDTGIILLIFILVILAVLLNLANIALSKFRNFFDNEDSNNQSNIEKLCLKVTNDYKKYSISLEYLKFIIILIITFQFNELFTNYIQLNENLLPDFLQIASSKSQSISYLLIFLVIIPILYIIIEIFPKAFSGKFYVKYSLISVLPVYFQHKLLFPIRFIFEISEKLFLFLFRKSNESDKLNTEEQIREIIEESTKAGNLELNESRLIDNIFDFKDTIVRQVMTPRSKIVSIGIDWTYKDIYDTVKTDGFSRYPVYENDLDNILGILHTKDIVGINVNEDSLIDKSVLRPAIFVKEDDFIDELLTNFQRKKILMAIVLDDFGGTSGIITMEDILEEIVGEINDEHDEINKDIEKIDDNNFLVVASINVRELNEVLPEELPESEEYESLGGLIITETDTIPELNTKLRIANYEIIILKRTKTKIEKVKLTYLSPSVENE